MEPLKNMYSTAFIEQVGVMGKTAIRGFSDKQFVAAVLAEGWEQLELKQRIRRISTVLHSMLSGDYTADVKQLLALTEVLHQYAGRDDTFLYMFVPDFIEQYGTKHVAVSLKAMERVTILSSCEYAIRPFIIQDKASVLAAMLQWTDNVHASVRRLASEGCRPRLPWGVALPELKSDPSLILPILERLKDDGSEFVRKSVANNLNDIAKDNPDVVLAIANRWKGQSKHTDWIIKHGCRTLLKKGDKNALAVFGLTDKPLCSVAKLQLADKKISIGEYLRFSFELTNDGEEAMTYRVEYAITYAKANSKQSTKVFKITENKYMPGESIRFVRKQSFADMTTRKHYTGAHSIAILINGSEQAKEHFEVV